MRRFAGKTRLGRSLGAGLAAGALLGALAGPALAQPDLGPGPDRAPASSAVEAWTSEDLAALHAALREAPAHGLDASALARALRTAGPDDPGRLSAVALTYARALAFGVVDPKRIHQSFSLETNRGDLAGELQAALSQHRLGEWLQSLAPQDATYRALSRAYLQTRAAVRAHPAGPALRARARTLALNLERLRWLDRTPPATRIDVNVAAARLWFLMDGAVLDSRKVVAGAPGHETPLLQASFRRIVVNPPWIVPHDIAAKEILPKGRRYLARHDMRIVDGRVIQEPGPDSSLGAVKFDLQDDADIYLHDTPQQSAFERADRHLSHGCVRVEDAVGFARLVAEQFGAADQLDDRLASGETASVSLDADVPVRLLYLTAYVDDGGVHFARDAYGWDADLAQALDLGEDALAIPVKPGP